MGLQGKLVVQPFVTLSALDPGQVEETSWSLSNKWFFNLVPHIGHTSLCALWNWSIWAMHIYLVIYQTAFSRKLSYRICHIQISLVPCEPLPVFPQSCHCPRTCCRWCRIWLHLLPLDDVNGMLDYFLLKKTFWREHLSQKYFEPFKKQCCAAWTCVEPPIEDSFHLGFQESGQMSQRNFLEACTDFEWR